MAESMTEQMRIVGQSNNATHWLIAVIEREQEEHELQGIDVDQHSSWGNPMNSIAENTGTPKNAPVYISSVILTTGLCHRKCSHYIFQIIPTVE